MKTIVNLLMLIVGITTIVIATYLYTRDDSKESPIEVFYIEEMDSIFVLPSDSAVVSETNH